MPSITWRKIKDKGFEIIIDGCGLRAVHSLLTHTHFTFISLEKPVLLDHLYVASQNSLTSTQVNKYIVLQSETQSPFLPHPTQYIRETTFY